MVVSFHRTGLHLLPCLGLLITFTLTACGLEVMGSADRVIGEQIELELTQGEPPLSGEFQMVVVQGQRDTGAAPAEDPQDIIYENAALEPSTVPIDDRVLYRLFPPLGLFAGPVLLEAFKEGGGEPYTINLTVSRVLAARDANNQVELLKLPSGDPLTIEGARPPAELIAVTPDAKLLLSAGGTQLGGLTLRGQGATALAAINSDGKPVGLAGIPGGALVATQGRRNAKDVWDVVVYRVNGNTLGGKQSFKRADNSTLSFDLEVLEVAATPSGARGAVLAECDLRDDDGVADDICLVELDLEQLTAGEPIALGSDVVDKQAVMTIGAAGDRMIVADKKRIYGVIAGGGVPAIGSREYEGQAEGSPIVDRTLTASGGADLDLFAVVDRAASIVYGIVLPPPTSQQAQLELVQGTPKQLPSQPTAAAFEAGVRLIVAAGTQLLRVDFARQSVDTLNARTASATQALSVQR